MIDVTQAIESAHRYVRKLYSESDLRELRLEEVELSEDDTRWNITLGWLESTVRGIDILISTDKRRLPRVYKLFEVDAKTGEVTAMKIREVG